MKKILYLLVTVLALSCTMNDSMPPHMKYGFTIIKKHSDQQKELGFSSCGSGGSFIGTVKFLGVAYSIQKSVEVEEAREIYVNAMESMLELCNSDSGFRPHMCCYPFTTKNIELDICFFDKKDNYIMNPKIAIVLCAHETIYYRVMLPDGSVEGLFEEPYETARKIVLGE